MSTRKKREKQEQDLIIEAFLNMIENNTYVPVSEPSVLKELDEIRRKS